MKKTVDIDGMTCMHCVASVERALNALDGVSAVSVGLENKQAVIDCADTVSNEAINEAVYDAGFDVISIENG